MRKYSYKLLRGMYDDVADQETWHVIIFKHTLLTNEPRDDGHGYKCTGQQIIETHTRTDEDFARSKGHRRVAELMEADPAEVDWLPA